MVESCHREFCVSGMAISPHHRFVSHIRSWFQESFIYWEKRFHLFFFHSFYPEEELWSKLTVTDLLKMGWNYQVLLLSWNISMEPKNHLIEKDNHLLKPSFLGFQGVWASSNWFVMCLFGVWNALPSVTTKTNGDSHSKRCTIWIYLFPLDMMACLLGWHPFYICW